MPQHVIDFTRLASAGHIARTRAAGDVIFREDEAGDCMYVVRAGEVDIRRGGKVVEKVGPGGLFGEMSLIDGSPRSATAVVATDCELYQIDEKTFVHLVHEGPHFALDVMRTLTARIRSMNELI